MTRQKSTGSYYSPTSLSRFITGYVAHHFKDLANLSILEPSVGDGSFVKAYNETQFPRTIKNFTFTAIDKIKPVLKKAEKAAFSNRKTRCKYSFTNVDFLKFQAGLRRRFHLIIGNPPYISKKFLNKTQIALCEEIHHSANLSDSSAKNIWSSFLVRCSQLLTDDGILAFILPAELLQVNFTQELRGFLLAEFTRTEIFTFGELLFDCKGQDTVLFIGFKRHRDPGQFYTHVSKIEQLESNNFELAKNDAIATKNIKWSHHLIPADDLQFIGNIGQKINKISHYCDSKPGIVTAANDFFIVNEDTEKAFDLSNYLKPIIQKALFVNGGVIFDNTDFKALLDDGRPAKVLTISDDDFAHLPDEVKLYLEIGASTELPRKYKCSKRKNWYVIPNISTAPKAFFLRRIHRYPKLIKNEADVFITDSAYTIEMRPAFEIEHLVYSFYNSLTLLFTELEGRYYGGGVLELTPKEFKHLPVPYVQISQKDFNSYVEEFRSKPSIDSILIHHDINILAPSLNLTTGEIDKIQSIYKVLIAKRFRG